VSKQRYLLTSQALDRSEILVNPARITPHDYSSASNIAAQMPNSWVEIVAR
jgi:hypothetical protein